MTDIRKLMEESTPLPIHHADLHEWLEERPANAPLTAMMLNAAPLVLEYMKKGHGFWCDSKLRMEKDSPKSRPCDCGYDNLARALGVAGE